jgi:hypothetical protein
MRLVAARPLSLIALLVLFATDPRALAQDTSQSPDSGVMVRPILTVRFSDVPPAPAFIAVIRFTLPPGTSITSGPTTGPRLFLAESGAITVTSTVSDSGFRRAADAPPAPSSSRDAATDAILRPGDHFLPPDPAPRELRNDGPRAAVFLDAMVFPHAPLGVVPYTTLDGVVVDPLVAGIADLVPTGLVELRIERLDIATGEQVALAVAPGPRLFVVESGTLGLAAAAGVITYSGAASNNPGSVAGRVRTVAPGSESLLTARGSVVVQAGASGAARNLGRTRLVLLSVTLQPVSQATATGLAATSATPEPPG